jgi:ribosomal protein S18 acetylase RimI-like enzyme
VSRVVSVRRASLADRDEIDRFEAAFDEALRPEEVSRFLADERHHLLLGYLDHRPAGFLSAVEIFHPDKRAELFLNEIGVFEEARRRGVATALVEELKQLGRERGCSEIWVLTDEGNRPATALYKATGGAWDGTPQAMYEYTLDDDRAQ